MADTNPIHTPQKVCEVIQQAFTFNPGLSLNALIKSQNLTYVWYVKFNQAQREEVKAYFKSLFFMSRAKLFRA